MHECETAGIPGEGSGGQSPGKTGETDADTVKTDTTAAGQTKEAETGRETRRTTQIPER